SCSNPNTHWNWRGVGDNHELYNTGTGGCLNALGGTSSGTPLGVYTCNSDQNEKFYKTYKPDGGGSGGSTETTGQKLIDRAHDWAGSPYVFGGGIHGTGYTQSFLNSCEHGTRGGNPVLSYACGTDCSGFISEVVDDVLGWHSVWTVNGGYMSGGNWTQISLSNVKPGDIVTVGDHVEFVQSGSGNNIVSFGDHHTGTNVSAVSTSGYYTRAFRWE
ncbi:MAG TPA: hypothetical protein VLG47_02180, partial [Candidatus Saccharimonadales bacterium]|nr:hypothetical protein [Candidatus Saccharimonadales bacterium]